jgi:hypothetical protein
MVAVGAIDPWEQVAQAIKVPVDIAIDQTASFLRKKTRGSHPPAGPQYPDYPVDPSFTYAPTFRVSGG